VEEKTMPSELLTQPLNGVVGDLELASNLSESGTGNQTVEHGLEEFGTAKPVAGVEGL